MRLHNVDILEKFLKDKALNKRYNAEKDDFNFKGGIPLKDDREISMLKELFLYRL